MRVERSHSFLDSVIVRLDDAVRTVFGQPPITGRIIPDLDVASESTMSLEERRLAAGLMRVNHAGEVCAQALYQGQALAARDPGIQHKLRLSAAEENDHLHWCDARLKDLDGHKSYFNPLWYAGSFGLGALAGAVGDQWSLGFLAETERQVVAHLDRHLERLPKADARSRAVLLQMRQDEGRHADVANAAGALPLPAAVRAGMRYCSSVMTSVSYYF